MTATRSRCSIAACLLLAALIGCDGGSVPLGSQGGSQFRSKPATPRPTVAPTFRTNLGGGVDPGEPGDIPSTEVSTDPGNLPPTAVPPPTTAPTRPPDALPSAPVTPSPSPSPTPLTGPTPGFTAVEFSPATFIDLFVPVAPDVTTPAGLATTMALKVLDSNTREVLSPDLFVWTTEATGVVSVDSQGVVTAVAGSPTRVEVRAAAKHNPAIAVSTFVRVRDAGTVDLEID